MCFLKRWGVLLALFFAVNILGHLFLREGLHRYYGLEKADVLCIGHSMSAMGIDKCMLEMQTGKQVSKYTMSGVGICERKIMLADKIISSFQAGKTAQSWIISGPEGIGKHKVVDEVVLAIYKGPKSFTGEDLVEIICHGSVLIANEIIFHFLLRFL